MKKLYLSFVFLIFHVYYLLMQIISLLVFFVNIHVINTKIINITQHLFIKLCRVCSVCPRSPIQLSQVCHVGLWSFWIFDKRNKLIKKRILQKLIGGSNELWFEILPDPVGHFYSAGGEVLKVVRLARREQVHLSLLDWYFTLFSIIQVFFDKLTKLVKVVWISNFY